MIKANIEHQLPGVVLSVDRELLSGGKVVQPDISFENNATIENDQRYFPKTKIKDSKGSVTARRFEKQTQRLEIVQNTLIAEDMVSEPSKFTQKPASVHKEVAPAADTKNRLSFRKMAELVEETNRFLSIDNQLHIYDKKHGLFLPLNSESGDALIRRQSPEKIKDQLSRYVISELILWLKSKTHWKKFDGEQLKNFNANYVNFQNCTVELPSLTVHDHNADFCCVNVLHVPYSNTFVDYRHSLFFKVINDLLGDSPKKICLLQEIYGAVIAGILLKHFYYFYGVPNSGKSKIADVLRYIVGTQYISAMTLKKFDSQFGLGGLHKKRLNIAGESSEITLAGVEVMKRLTGDDYTQAEKKYEQQFDFSPDAALVFMSNHKLRVTDGQPDEAFLNRMVVLEFCRSVQPERQDAKLSGKLKAPHEIDAAVAWALDGARRIYDNNFKLSYYPDAADYISSSASTTRNRQAELANQFKAYLAETFDIEPKNRENYVAVSDIFNAFMDYIGTTEDFEYRDSLYLHGILQDEFNLEKKRIKPTGQKQQVYAYTGIKPKKN